MADVFISYSSEDRGRAEKLAKSLEREGISVFWDREIAPGSTWDEVIERELEQASAVVVLWSSASIRSRWVKAESEEGAARNVLVPAMIEDVKIPLAFRPIQTVDLRQSDFSRNDPEMTRLLASINHLTGKGEKLDEEPSNRLRRLIESLGNPNVSVQLNAAKTLGRMGGEAGEAAPALIKLLDSSDLDLLDAVVDALDAIDLDQALPALEKLYSKLESQRPGDTIDGSEPEDDLLGKLLILTLGP